MKTELSVMATAVTFTVTQDRTRMGHFGSIKESYTRVKESYFA